MVVFCCVRSMSRRRLLDPRTWVACAVVVVAEEAPAEAEVVVADEAVEAAVSV